MTKRVKIGGAGGFWGDSNAAPAQLVQSGQVDYLIMDYLAELTMSILAKARFRDPKLGYATDFATDVLPSIMAEIAAGKVKVVTNAGGMNPRACAAALQAAAQAAGVSLKVGVVEGDDLQPRWEELTARGDIVGVDGAPIPDEVVSVNAYIGAEPVRAALAMGADVVVTGRCADSALALGILMHEFGWASSDFDLMASGTLVGHLVECGTQVTGGLYTDWREVPGRANLGYPIADCAADGSFELFKPDGTGGLITPLVAAEQMLYEVGDPSTYLLPDVTCDFREVTIRQVGENRVLIDGARGRAPTGTYKASATFEAGSRASATMTVIGEDAAAKAEHMGEMVLERTRAMFRARNWGDYEETRVEALGSEASSFGSAASHRGREVVLRIAVRHPDEKALRLFAKEIAPMGTAGVPGVTGFSGRPKAQKVFRLFSTLIAKSAVELRVTVGDETVVLPPMTLHAQTEATDLPAAAATPVADDAKLTPIRRLAVARSGDKGDLSNIAVIARSEAAYADILNGLTEEVVRTQLGHLAKGQITRYVVPGVQALNFTLEEALAGGGSVSLRSDALGKAFAQILLDAEIPAATSAVGA